MAIERFAYRDLATGWCLTGGGAPAEGALPAPVELGPVNLLVGPSGAGKSRALAALRDVASAAQQALPPFGWTPCEWSITFGGAGQAWTWQARTTILPASDEEAMRNAFESERLHDAAGDMVAERTAENESKLLGRHGPRLKRQESILSLMAGEPAIAPIQAALRHVVQVDAGLMSALVDTEALRATTQGDLQTLRGIRASLVQRSWLLQQRFPVVFAEVVERYRAIFPTIEAVEIHQRVLQPERVWMGFRIREEGVPYAIELDDLSAGMQRVLKFLFQVALAPDGSVFLIDEVENSLGVNCLDGVMDHLLTSGRDLQLIMTSHHPYVINTVPRSAWQVVTRKGSVVTLRPASAFPRLAGRSHQDAFIQLLNTPEFEHGIQ